MGVRHADVVLAVDDASLSAGDLLGVKELVQSGEIDVNEPGAQDRTALHRRAPKKSPLCPKKSSESVLFCCSGEPILIAAQQMDRRGGQAGRQELLCVATCDAPLSKSSLPLCDAMQCAGSLFFSACTTVVRALGFYTKFEALDSLIPLLIEVRINLVFQKQQI